MRWWGRDLGRKAVRWSWKGGRGEAKWGRGEKCWRLGQRVELSPWLQRVGLTSFGVSGS